MVTPIILTVMVPLVVGMLTAVAYQGSHRGTSEHLQSKRKIQVDPCPLASIW